MTQSRPRIFALSPSHLDVTRAKEYGEIIYIFPPPERMPNVFSADFTEIVWGRMQELDFDRGRDYILIMGSMVAVSQWVAAVVSAEVCCKALLYNVVENRYLSRMIGFNDLEDIPQENKEHG